MKHVAKAGYWVMTYTGDDPDWTCYEPTHQDARETAKQCVVARPYQTVLISNRPPHDAWTDYRSTNGLQLDNVISKDGVRTFYQPEGRKTDERIRDEVDSQERQTTDPQSMD